jgi:diguanylate cyclase (GGDEF)-like protein
MTGLLNRRAGEAILSVAHQKAISTREIYSVFMVDIDHFKKVNDTHGHDVGDEAIKMVSSIIKHTVRNIDAACRWGGEEFLCILQGADTAIANTIADRIRTGVEMLMVPVAGKITVSIGISTWREGVTDASKLVKLADTALYKAKQNGRNRVVVADPI